MRSSKRMCKLLIFILLLIYFKTTDSYSQYGKDWIYFPDGDGVPHLVSLHPSDIIATTRRIKQEEVEFRLYTKNNLGHYIILNDLNSMEEVSTSKILTRFPLKIITHGWMSGADKSGVMSLVNAYLQAENEVNIITVDWSRYSINYFYETVVHDTKEVAASIAKFLDLLHKEFNVSGAQIHLIGHSLGAHVMGIAGYQSHVKIGRITGLDPALPLFDNIQDKKSRLDYDDAIFVDVIHTCGGFLGFWDALGKADFYPNNGIPPQPGCRSLGIFKFDACSHGRSIEYFAESILNPIAFPSYECNSWNQDMEHNCPLVGYMGEHANWDMTGIYYLKTNSEEPYGRGILKSNQQSILNKPKQF